MIFLKFEQYVLGNVNKKYTDMYAGAARNPINVNIQIDDYGIYDKKRLDYRNRLVKEKNEYNQALQTIITIRNNRIKEEDRIARETAQRKRDRLDFIKQAALTAVLSLPGVIMVIIGILMSANPLSIFRHIAYGWWIAIYVVFALLYIVMGIIVLAKKDDVFSSNFAEFFMEGAIHRGVLMMLCAVGFTVSMILGVINLGGKTFQISTPEDFGLIAKMPGSTSYILTEDIDFEGKEFLVWGKVDKFSGTFDGQGFSLKNITVNRNIKKGNWGIFNNLEGTVKDLTIVNPQINIIVEEGEGNINIGILSGFAGGSATIENCRIIDCQLKSQVKLKYQRNSHEDYVEHPNIGGFAGTSLGAISRCEIAGTRDFYSEFNVTFDGDTFVYMGGIVGYANSGSYVLDCVSAYTKFSLYSSTDAAYFVNIGAIVGGASTDVENCVSISDYEVNIPNGTWYNSNERIGNICGRPRWSGVSNCVFSENGLGVVGDANWNDSYGAIVDNIVIERDQITAFDLPSVFACWEDTDRGYPTPCR